MKIRKGFISNSSSTSFMIFLPDDYKSRAALKERIRIAIDKADEDDEDDDETVTVDMVLDAITSLQKDGWIWGEECTYILVDVLITLFYEDNLVVKEANLPPGGDNFININIPPLYRAIECNLKTFTSNCLDVNTC